MNFEAIRKSSAPEMVAEQILNQIKSGDLAPGDRLPHQRELASNYERAKEEYDLHVEEYKKMSPAKQENKFS